MLIDKEKFNQLMINIKFLPGTSEIITKNKEAMSLIDDISNIYSDLLGVISVEDNITNEVLNSDIISLISTLREILIGIKDSKGGIPTSLYNAIGYVLEINPYDSEYSERQICTNCNGMMIYEKKYLRCMICDAIKYNNTDKYNIDKDNNNDITNRNNNIVKHFHKNLSYIYGENLPEKLPEQVIDQICEEIRINLPDLHESVHPSYDVHELLQNMRLILYKNKYCKPKMFKTYANAFIIRAFPNITIPKLKSEDHDFIHKMFLDITAEQLNINTQDTSNKASKYNNNYQFTIHRIMMMSRLYEQEYIRELMRYIYIQSPASFEHKDKKLRKVNENIRCFPVFFDTPLDIYINDRYYTR